MKNIIFAVFLVFFASTKTYAWVFSEGDCKVLKVRPTTIGYQINVDPNTSINVSDGGALEINILGTFVRDDYQRYDLVEAYAFKDGTWLRGQYTNSAYFPLSTGFVSNVEVVESLPSECPAVVPPTCTDEDVASAILECGDANYEMFEIPGPDPEHSDCGWTCNNRECNDEYQLFSGECAYGVATFDWDTCAGTCKKCYPDARADVEDICRGRGGVYYFKCLIDDVDDYVDIKYSCAYDEGEVPEEIPDEVVIEPPEDTYDGTSPPEPDSSNPPADPNDPDNQPAAEPVDAPDATEPEKTNNRLDAINENEGTQVDQNNAQIGQLNTIIDNSETTANNTQIIAQNQGNIQDEVRHNSEVNREGYEMVASHVDTGFSEVVGAINSQSSTTYDVEDMYVDNSTGIDELDFSELATSNPVPTLDGSEFNSDLPTDNDYTEFDDNTTLASDQATAFAEENLTLDPENSPINAEVTASGDPCLNGNITIHNHQIPVSICFNKPWMLDGYAVMKILMIGLAYLQTAMLLNKAIVK